MLAWSMRIHDLTALISPELPAKNSATIHSRKLWQSCDRFRKNFVLRGGCDNHDARLPACGPGVGITSGRGSLLAGLGLRGVRLGFRGLRGRPCRSEERLVGKEGVSTC